MITFRDFMPKKEDQNSKKSVEELMKLVENSPILMRESSLYDEVMREFEQEDAQKTNELKRK